VHGVPPEASNVDAVIIEYVPIEPIVMPHFQVLLVLEVGFEIID
jgi:hypothetical protein